MSEILPDYHKVDPTTWAYLSSLATIGLFFKFSRFWSVRNLDLVLLILLAPGLMLVHHGTLRFGKRLYEPAKSAVPSPLADTPVADLPGPLTTALTVPIDPAAPSKAAEPEPSPEEAEERAAMAEDRRIARMGFLWLFVVGGLWVVRLLLDPTMVRRPLLEPNLSQGGLAFVGCALFLFLASNVITGSPSEDDLRGAKGATAIIKRNAADQGQDYRRHGPGFYMLNMLPSIPTLPFQRVVGHEEQRIQYAAVAKTMAVLGHLAVVLGIVAIGHWHFENLKMGIGTAALYLLLPYTAQMTGRVDHVLPSALLLWAVMLYRRPMTAGVLIGLAMGVCYYPLFLLPLWISFYWHRGLLRYFLGVGAALVITALSLLLVSEDLASYWEKIRAMFGLWIPVTTNLEGIWGLGWDPIYRLTVLAGFVTLSGSMALWPAQKNLGTLLSCSAAIMVATQFWHGYGGGLFMGWYLPLLLLTVFRPNLEDRVALSVLHEGWFVRRRGRLGELGQAA
jgi:hypothetical protein